MQGLCTSVRYIISLQSCFSNKKRPSCVPLFTRDSLLGAEALVDMACLCRSGGAHLPGRPPPSQAWVPEPLLTLCGCSRLTL